MYDNFLPEFYSLRLKPYTENQEDLFTILYQFYMSKNEVPIDQPQYSYTMSTPEVVDPDSLVPDSTVQPSTVALLLVLLYVAYYQYVIVKKPDVICHDPQRMKELKEYCPVLFEKYQVTPWATNSYMQTVLRCIIQTSPVLEKRREELVLTDGGRVCLDWYNEQADDQPTALMLPGMTGSSDENYIRHWIQDMTELGYRSVVFNYRGCGNKLTTPKMYCGSEIGDLVQVVSRLTTIIPNAPMIAIATSLGSMILLKYTIEKKAPFRAIFLVSALWDSYETDKIMNRYLCKYTLSRVLVTNYLDMIKQNRVVFEESEQKGELPFDLHTALEIRDMRTLVGTVIGPMFGRTGAIAVCDECYSHTRVDDLTIPILSLSSIDDPITTRHGIPEKEAQRNTNLMLVTTERGGHIGFLEGLLPLNKTLIDRVLVQFARAVFEHGAFS